MIKMKPVKNKLIIIIVIILCSYILYSVEAINLISTYITIENNTSDNIKINIKSTFNTDEFWMASNTIRLVRIRPWQNLYISSKLVDLKRSIGTTCITYCSVSKNSVSVVRQCY